LFFIISLSSTLIRKLMKMCREVIFIRVWRIICCFTFSIIINLRWIARSSKKWLWATFLIMKFHFSNWRVITASNENLHDRLKILLRLKSWRSSFLSLSHLKIVFRRTFFLLILILFLTIAYSWSCANSLIAIMKSLKIKKFNNVWR
jgi:hypothetical protein